MNRDPWTYNPEERWEIAGMKLANVEGRPRYTVIHQTVDEKHRPYGADKTLCGLILRPGTALIVYWRDRLDRPELTGCENCRNTNEMRIREDNAYLAGKA